MVVGGGGRERRAGEEGLREGRGGSGSHWRGGREDSQRRETRGAVNGGNGDYKDCSWEDDIDD